MNAFRLLKFSKLISQYPNSIQIVTQTPNYYSDSKQLLQLHLFQVLLNWSVRVQKQFSSQFPVWGCDAFVESNLFKVPFPVLFSFFSLLLLEILLVSYQERVGEHKISTYIIKQLSLSPEYLLCHLCLIRFFPRVSQFTVNCYNQPVPSVSFCSHDSCHFLVSPLHPTMPTLPLSPSLLLSFAFYSRGGVPMLSVNKSQSSLFVNSFFSPAIVFPISLPLRSPSLPRCFLTLTSAFPINLLSLSSLRLVVSPH